MRIINEEITIELKTIKEQDLPLFWKIAYQDNLEWLKYDAPYFEEPVLKEDEFVKEYGLTNWVNNSFRLAIFFKDNIIGTVSAYYKDGKLKRWLEIGIDIYDQNYWNKGLGYRALKLYITYLFDKLPIQKIGFTTWSGNIGMMKLGEKLKFKKEGQIRKVRFWNNKYWDSVSYGVLKEEWEGIQYEIR